MTPITFTRVLPDRATVEVDALARALGQELAAAAPEHRPYTIVNFVSTADGSATFRGRSGAIGDDGDRALFHSLREQVDAVLAGTGTLRVERYGRILSKAERRERRVARGRPAEPLACVITRTGDLPLDIPLFQEPEAEIVLFSPLTEPPPAGARLHLEPYKAAGPAPLGTAMQILRQRYGVGTLLCEGGPALFGALLREELVDELFLTLAPKLAGGAGGPAVASGPPLPELRPMRLTWALERDGSLYLRYTLA